MEISLLKRPFLKQKPHRPRAVPQTSPNTFDVFQKNPSPENLNKLINDIKTKVDTSTGEALQNLEWLPFKIWLLVFVYCLSVPETVIEFLNKVTYEEVLPPRFFDFLDTALQHGAIFAADCIAGIIENQMLQMKQWRHSIHIEGINWNSFLESFPPERIAKLPVESQTWLHHYFVQLSLSSPIDAIHKRLFNPSFFINTRHTMEDSIVALMVEHDLNGEFCTTNHPELVDIQTPQLQTLNLRSCPNYKTAIHAYVFKVKEENIGQLDGFLKAKDSIDPLHLLPIIFAPEHASSFKDLDKQKYPLKVDPDSTWPDYRGLIHDFDNLKSRVLYHI